MIGVDTITQIITAALSHKHTNPKYKNPIDMQNEFIEILEKLADPYVGYPEVKSKSLNTLYQVLRNSGQVKIK